MTELLYFLGLVSVWVCGYVYGVIKTRHEFARIIVEDPDRILDAIETTKQMMEMDESSSVEVYAEQHNERWFIYEKTTNQFLAQGSSIIQALEVAHARFPGKTFEAPTS